MRRLCEQPRKCGACGKVMQRRRWSDGRLEAPTLYARRRYCDNTCKGDAMMTGKRYRGPCLRCGTTLKRKHFASGWEPKAEFAKRRFCDRACHDSYYDDILNQLERRAERSAAYRRRAGAQP